jgi:hypothetical protein
VLKHIDRNFFLICCALFSTSTFLSCGKKKSETGDSPKPSEGVSQPENTAPVNEKIQNLAPIDYQCETYAANGARICSAIVNPISTLNTKIQEVSIEGEISSHFVCRPENVTNLDSKVLLHLVGTFSNPARDFQVAKAACALGFKAIEPAYHNERTATINCQGSTSDCFEDYRKQITYGENFSAFVEKYSGVGTEILLDTANSIFSRTQNLLNYLQQADTSSEEGKSFSASWNSALEQFSSKNLTNFILSGHSQGSGHALLLARDFAASRLLQLGGVGDRMNTGTPQNYAPDWILNFANPKTLQSNFYSFLSAEDSIIHYDQTIDNYNEIGIDSGGVNAGNGCARVTTAGQTYDSNCRRIYIPAQGCSGTNAHNAVISLYVLLGGCTSGTITTNFPTFQYLFGK